MNEKTAWEVNRVILGLLMLVAGLLKLFVVKPAGVTGMLTGLGFPAPLFFAWVLLLSEIIFGIAILAKYKLEWTTWPPVIILVIAAFTASWANWTTLILHIVAASNYWLLGVHSMNKK
ncbi:MAG: DoxX family protein [Candidatus Pacearchaeota archaeon]|nr:DoxX family protein [Candidatus Pacearchaeota archaeon]